jgi:hypothetical protein
MEVSSEEEEEGKRAETSLSSSEIKKETVASVIG